MSKESVIIQNKEKNENENENESKQNCKKQIYLNFLSIKLNSTQIDKSFISKNLVILHV